MPDRERDADEKAQRAVQSIEVGGRLLLALGASRGPMSLKDLAAAASLPASRAHPYLVSFCKLRLIAQDPDTGRYALGPAALQLGLTSLTQLEPLRAATPVAQELAAATGYAVGLALWGNFGATIVRMIDAQEPLHVAMRAGTVMSLLGTATGRAFAGALSPERLAQAVGTALGAEAAARGAMSEADAQAVQAARDELQAHGVTRALGRPVPGVNAFSAPAYDHEGQAAIVVTALGHQDRFPVGWDSAAAEAVRRAAGEISARLGWRADARPATAPARG